MITPNDLRMALHDLAIAIPLSCVNDDGAINAYEYNGTARAIIIAAHALAKIREAESEDDSN